MIEFISNMSLPTAFARSSSDSASVVHSMQSTSSHLDQRDFQAMVEEGEPGESWASVDAGLASAASAIAASPGGGLMDMVRNVDTSKATMQAALLRVSISNKTEDIQAAAVALSRYDIQTLFLSKVANKALQAVDRLTNLQ